MVSISAAKSPARYFSGSFCKVAAREVLQAHFGVATLHKDPEKYLAGDFAALMETMALAGGMKLASENKKVPTGLES